MQQISFKQLKAFVDAKTKEERVPSARKLMDRETRPVIHGRFGRYGRIKIEEGGRTSMQSSGPGLFEEVRLYPADGCLAGNDLSRKSIDITVRSGDGMAHCVSSYDSELHLSVDGFRMPDGTWLPELQKREWRNAGASPRYREYADGERDRFLRMMEGVSEITVFTDGSVLYYSAGRHSVFSLCRCADYQYVSVTDTVSMRREVLEALPWHIFLTMIGEGRIAKNSLNKKKEDRWNRGSEDARIFDLFVKEYFRETARKDLLWEMLLELDDETRDMILLFYFDGWKQNEIALVFHYSRETVSRKINAGIARMKEIYWKK